MRHSQRELVAGLHTWCSNVDFKMAREILRDPVGAKSVEVMSFSISGGQDSRPLQVHELFEAFSSKCPTSFNLLQGLIDGFLKLCIQVNHMGSSRHDLRAKEAAHFTFRVEPLEKSINKCRFSMAWRG